MRTRRGRRTRLASTTPQERVAVGTIAVIAAIGALAAGAHPTPHLYGDVVLTVAFAVLVTLAASVARTWAWIVLASAAAVFAAPNHPEAAFGVEGIALVAALVDIGWRRVYGALVGAASVQLLLRLGG